MKSNLTLLFLFSILFTINAQDSTNKKWTLRECVDYALENN